MDQLPITPPIAPIGDQRPGTGRFARNLAQRRAAKRPPEDDESGFHEILDGTAAADPARPLLEALDRLRVTNEVRPAEAEYAKALRALKAYHEPAAQGTPHEVDPTAVPPG